MTCYGLCFEEITNVENPRRRARARIYGQLRRRVLLTSLKEMLMIEIQRSREAVRMLKAGITELTGQLGVETSV